MTKYYAQQCVLSPMGIQGCGVMLDADTLDDIKASIIKNPTHVYPWIIFKCADEGNRIFPVMYVDINEGKWLDL